MRGLRLGSVLGFMFSGQSGLCMHMRIGRKLLACKIARDIGLAPLDFGVSGFSWGISVQGWHLPVLALSSTCQLIMSTQYVPKSSKGFVGYSHASNAQCKALNLRSKRDSK